MRVPSIDGPLVTCERVPRMGEGLSPRLLRYDWPGNVRELENAIEHAVVLGSGLDIDAEDLPEHLLEEPLTGRDAESGYHAAVNAAKRQLIEDAIERAAGNYAQAARLLALQPTYLHRLIRKLGVRKRG